MEMSINPLTDLSNENWFRLQNLLTNFDDKENQLKIFLDATRRFTEEYFLNLDEQRRNYERNLQKYHEDIFFLCDRLEIERTSIDLHEQFSFSERENFLRHEIQRLKILLDEKEKELNQIKKSIQIKSQCIGNIQIDLDKILTIDEGQQILGEFSTRLDEQKRQIGKLFSEISDFDSLTAEKYSKTVKIFLSINDENLFSWIEKNPTINGNFLFLQLEKENQRFRQNLLDEVLRLRQELDQPEPTKPIDLKEELENLRLRQRYFILLKDFPNHRLNSRSTLDEIRRTYDQLTASIRAKAREKLKYLWDQLDFPENQRNFPKTSTNEEDFLAMNDEIHRLETYVESIRPLLTKIQKREWFKKEMVEFEKRAGDPARLRGSSTQLLREEKFRKDLSREFPKLTDDLRRMVAEWEETTGHKLIYAGESYLQTMNQEKLSVDFELLHLRLLTKCQILNQPTKDDPIPLTPPPPSPTPSTNSIRSTNSSRIPTPNFSNSIRKNSKAS